MIFHGSQAERSDVKNSSRPKKCRYTILAHTVSLQALIVRLGEVWKKTQMINFADRMITVKGFEKRDAVSAI